MRDIFSVLFICVFSLSWKWGREVKSFASWRPFFFPMHCSGLFFLPQLHSIPMFCVSVVISLPLLPYICQLLLWSEVVTVQVSHWQEWVRRDCRCSMFSWFGELVEFWRRCRRHGKWGRKLLCCKSNGEKKKVKSFGKKNPFWLRFSRKDEEKVFLHSFIKQIKLVSWYFSCLSFEARLWSPSALFYTKQRYKRGS